MVTGDSDSKLTVEKSQVNQATLIAGEALSKGVGERVKARTMVSPSGMTAARVRLNPIRLNGLMEPALKLKTEVLCSHPLEHSRGCKPRQK